MTPRKPGRCRGCGAKTQRTSNIQCSKCAKSDVALAVTDAPLMLELSDVQPHPITLDDLFATFKTDREGWEVCKFSAGRVRGKEQAYSAKVLLKAATARGVEARSDIDTLLREAGEQMPERVPVRPAEPSGYLLELAIPDLHLGKLAWGAETGGANYDSKIAVRVWREAVEALLGRTAAFTPERIVLVVGNDFFHSDTKAGTTTKGTPLDVDGRFQKMFATGRKLITDTAERLAGLAPVTLVMCAGNHDTLANYCLGDALECWFHNTPAVTVMNAPTPRKYLQHGKVMLMWTHGDKGKLSDLPLLMATEQPAMFGATRFREAHTGDKHTRRALQSLGTAEHMGVTVRISPALCAADAWHSENQFVGNLRAAEAFVWSKDEGLVAQAMFTVQP